MKIKNAVVSSLAVLSLAAQAAPADYTVTYDYSPSPVQLAPGDYPLLVNVDFGKSFTSYQDLFVSVSLAESGEFVKELGVVLSGSGPFPDYAEVKPWGSVVMGTLSISVTPSNSLSWNSGWGSEHWQTYGRDAISNEILDGKFVFYFQNAPMERTPSLSFRESFSVLNVSVTLHDAEVATPVPEPETYAMMLAGLGLLGFVARRRKQKAVA